MKDELFQKKDRSLTDVWIRGMEFIEGLKKGNPCADLYYIVVRHAVILDSLLQEG